LAEFADGEPRVQLAVEENFRAQVVSESRDDALVNAVSSASAYFRTSGPSGICEL
jgi:hypothetical protein